MVAVRQPAASPTRDRPAAVIAFVLTPLTAVVTKGKYDLRRAGDGIDEPLLDADGNPSATTYDCHVCHQPYERPDLAACQTHDAVVCSLCLSTDKVKDHVLPAQPTVVRTPGPGGGADQSPRSTSRWTTERRGVPPPGRRGLRRSPW